MRDFFKYFKNFDDIIAFVKFITQTTDTTSAKKLEHNFIKTCYEYGHRTKDTINEYISRCQKGGFPEYATNNMSETLLFAAPHIAKQLNTVQKLFDFIRISSFMNNEFFVSQLRTMVLDPNNNETVLNPNTNKSVSDSTQNANFPGCRILSKILHRNR